MNRGPRGLEGPRQAEIVSHSGSGAGNHSDGGNGIPSKGERPSIINGYMGYYMWWLAKAAITMD